MGAIFRLLLLVAVAGALSVPLTRARADVVPQVRSQQIRDFVRLTFEWPETTLFTARTSGNDVILTFDQKASPNMGEVLKQLHPFVTKAERKADGRTIVLTLDKPYRVRTFISDNVSGIDLLDIKPGDELTVAKMARQPKPQITAKAEPEPDFDALSPAAGESPAQETQLAQALTPQAQPQPEPEPAPQAAPVDETAPPAEPPAFAPEEIVPQTAPSADAATPAAQPFAPQEAQAPPAQEAQAQPAGAVAEPPAATPPAAENPPPPAPETAAQPAPEAAPVPVPLPPEPPNPAAASVNPVTPPATEEQIRRAEEELQQKHDGSMDKITRDTSVSLAPMSVAPDDSEPAPSVVIGEEKEPEPEPEPEPEAVTPVQSAPAAEPLNTESSQDGQSSPEALSSNKIVVSADEDGATIRIPLKERTAGAVFVRMNQLWLVFDKKLEFDFSDFDVLPAQTIIGKAAVLANDKATIIRVPVADNIYPKIRQQEGNFDMAVLLSPAKSIPDEALEVIVSTEPPAPPHVFLPILEPGSTIDAEDPLIGDKLSITPVYTREQGLAEQREFVQFTLLPSTQGLVIAKKADSAEVIALRNGLRVALPRGTYLSPDQHGAVQEGAALPASAEGTLFPDELWALEKSKSMKRTEERLVHQTVFGANESTKNLARLRLAQLYLRNGFAVEAIGYLDNIQRTNRSYFRSAKLAAMRGAANFLLYRFHDAARDFNAAELNNNPEIDYWRDMIADLLGNPQKTYDFLSMNHNYISKYPPIFRQRLAIVAADRAIGAKEYNNALKIFDTLAQDEIIGPIQPYVDFLTAKISAENGQEEQAIAEWRRLSEDYDHPFVKARATFSLILWELDNNAITRDQVVDKLERLRLGWHGDGLELQVVQLLGELYLEKKDYVNAMRVWHIGVTGFKNTAPALDMERKMEDVFVKLFNEGIADRMTPLEALALYYEYRSYTPTGAIGAQMLEKLADRLVSVDLLSTAANLLEQQMRTQMEKSERSRLGAKLADIYLMDNVPKKALRTLQESVYGDNPILLRIYRNQLAADAMLRMGRTEEALTVLGSDESAAAEKLRALIYWESRDWNHITTAIENMFKKRTDPSLPLTVEEGEFAVRLALSYVFQGDDQQLQYMADYFGPLMVGNPYKEAFDFVTKPDIKLSTRNFDDLLAALSDTRAFVNKYEARVELAGSEAPAAEPVP